MSLENPSPSPASAAEIEAARMLLSRLGVSPGSLQRSPSRDQRIAATTGNNPALDALLLRLHTETACRRGGALALRPRDLDPTQCLIFLREKGKTVRWQPVSPTLMTHLRQHAEHHHTPPGQQLLRSLGGTPITTRRYDYLWSRLGKHLPWVATQQISTHWLRHTTLTWVERNFGHAVARPYAGHSGNGHGEGTTAVYTRAGLEEVTAALAALTGEPHPLTASGGSAPPKPPKPERIHNTNIRSSTLRNR